jgi:hypothetical protein
VGPGGVTVGYSSSGREAAPGSQEARQALAELLDLPAALHRADSGMTIVCFDEFQDLLVADGQIDGLVRSVIQHHGDAAAYVYAGSEPSLMRALFEGRERPLYGQARPLVLSTLSPAETVRQIGRRPPGNRRDSADRHFRRGPSTAHHAVGAPPLQPAGRG